MSRIVHIVYNVGGHTSVAALEPICGDVIHAAAIVEHKAQGEGDKFYYDIIFRESEREKYIGSKIRVFNPITVTWE